MEAEKTYLNILKGILIILVVIGHFGQTIANNIPYGFDYIGKGVVLFIYSFHMPLFLCVSGYLSKNFEKQRKKCFKDLLIPYILFQLLVGFLVLLVTKSNEVLMNIFTPFMGAWYLLTLFSYRFVLPEICKMRGILILGLISNVFSFAFGWIGTEFALNKTFGFFIYFLIGYYLHKIPHNSIPKYIARIMLIIIFIIFLLISYKIDWYNNALLVLSRSADSEIHLWHRCYLWYLLTLIITVVMMFLVINAIPENSKWLENIGRDTLPMYLSHLLLFMAIGFLINKDNCYITIMISFLGILISIWLFSSSWYRKLFNIVLSTVKNYVMKE